MDLPGSLRFTRVESIWCGGASHQSLIFYTHTHTHTHPYSSYAYTYTYVCIYIHHIHIYEYTYVCVVEYVLHINHSRMFHTLSLALYLPPRTHTKSHRHFRSLSRSLVLSLSLPSSTPPIYATRLIHMSAGCTVAHECIKSRI